MMRLPRGSARYCNRPSGPKYTHLDVPWAGRVEAANRNVAKTRTRFIDSDFRMKFFAQEAQVGRDQRVSRRAGAVGGAGKRRNRFSMRRRPSHGIVFLMPVTLKNQVVLVVGASSGIGHETAL